MKDKDIVNLYLQRNKNAINETDLKYGRYCKTIARNILGNSEDAEECVNDTYLHTWNSIPPKKPKALSTYLGKITRNLSFDKFRYNNAEKRGGGEIKLVLDELEECVSGNESVENELNKQHLINEINSFLNTIPKESCDIFLCRYWYVMSVCDIAKQFGITENNTSVILNRTRNKLKAYLIERGFEL
ncbi:MAG: sigma-70 family RNA polymerase sigma factor [Clostridia bacterium]|nr:sigma-70 family RNA polymerase sigma factor [Clostridia bacterium]